MANILSASHLFEVTEIVSAARVPLIRFTDKKFGTECEMSMNNYLGVVNSNLLRIYTEFDPRTKEMILLVKEWAKRRNIASTAEKTLSSYAWTLLCVFYLQTTSPPVLPVLPDMMEEILADNSNSESLM